MATPTSARTRVSSRREQAAALVAAALLGLLPACDRLFPYSAARADAAPDRVGPHGALLEAGSAAWLDPAWPLRKRLVAAPAGGAEDLAGFPLLVSLDRDADLAAHAPSAEALRFVSEDGQLLAHDVERYDASSGALTAWVRLPALRATAPTELYLYLGGPGWPAAPAAEDVWAGSAVVLHFGEAGDTPAAARNAAWPGAPAEVRGATVDPAGKIAGALAFARDTDQVLPAGLAPLVDGWNALHVSFWLRLGYASDAEWEEHNESKVIEQWGALFAGRTYPTGESGLGAFQVDVSLSERGTLNARGELARQRWTHLALTLDGQELVLYVDGRAAWRDPAPADRFAAGEQPLTLGCSVFEWRSFRGLLDEVRVGAAPRSANWIAAEHAYQSDPAALVTAGPLEALGH